MSDELKSSYNQFFELVLKLKTVEDCAELFEDLCTYKELDAFATRIQAAKMIKERKTFNQICSEIDISSATLARVSKCYKHGKGYKKFL